MNRSSDLAGDEFPAPSNDSIIATGYYRLGTWDNGPADKELARYDMLDDIVATTSQVFLGLTVDCARCHDHKIDPIAQRDYYALLSFFHNVNHYKNGGPTDEVPLASTTVDAKLSEQLLKDREAQLKELELETADLEGHYRSIAKPAKGTGGIVQLINKDGVQVLGQEAFDRYQELRKKSSP